MEILTAPIRMIRDIRALGGGIRIWGAALNLPQIIGGVIFIATIEGLAILVTALATLLVAGNIHRKAPFSRLISICHLPWLGLAPWLIGQMLGKEFSTAMLIWLIYVTGTIIVSLVLDIREIILYFRGDRVFAWAETGDHAKQGGTK